MKHQFKFNPLATAVLTLLCGHSVSSYAQTTDQTSSVTNLNNQQLKHTIQEAYPGQQFFEQYYVDKAAPEAQQQFGHSQSSAYCEGAWLTPISSGTVAADAENGLLS